MLHFFDLSSDTLFLACLFVIFFAFSAYFGRGRAISVLLGYFPAVYFYKSFPFAQKLSVLQGPQLSVLNQIGIFLIFLIPLSIIIERFIFSEMFGGSGGSMFKNAGLALIMLILVMLFSYNVVNLDVFHNFSPAIDQLFASQNLLFYWSLAPFALLAFL